MSRPAGEWGKVAALLDRHANLNQLRVGTIQVYLVVVAAVLALLGGTDAADRTDSFVIPLGLCLVGVGLLVYLYDLRCRARAFAVAKEVARTVSGTSDAQVKALQFDEDLFFSLILMLVNSTLVYIGLEQGYVAGDLGDGLVVILACAFFAAQVAFYCWYWPRLARGLSAWPDAFAPQAIDEEREPGEDQEA